MKLLSLDSSLAHRQALAKELGYDAGFSKGTYPHHVASFIVRELAERVGEDGATAAHATAHATSSNGAAPPPHTDG